MSVESINTSPQIQPAVTTPQADGKQAKAEQSKQATTTPVLAEVTQIDRQELDAAVDKLNNFVSNSAQRNLSFSIDKDTKEMVVTVRDTETQEVIRQMPTKEALAVAKQIESMLGLILNDKA
ncbi:MAG: flagellar protein FlaG [Pseudomonadales bacterium]|nr:flagellar protein FlaG [Pseudomonadales bacterium]NRA17341.1 flagellar protein FlaG [Oceanospirillaceae bacterium]